MGGGRGGGMKGDTAGNTSGGQDEVVRMFDAGHAALRQAISDYKEWRQDPPGAPDIARIVQAYHTVISVSAAISALRSRAAQDPVLGARIAGAEALIRDGFDREIHPRISSYLSESVREQTARLRGAKGGAGGGGEPAESDRAAQYGMLRQTMSAAEFVGQYGRSAGVG